MAEIVTASILANSEVITATLTSGSEQMTAIINVAARGPMGPVGSGAWGTITGTLSNQTDLQTALNLKANLASPTFTGVVTAPRITGRCDGLEVLCKAGLAINAGQVVYVTGASGTNIVIGLAQANAEATSSKTLGISESTLANNATGYVITEGLMTVSIAGGSATQGDPIWLSPTTAGGMVFGLANKPSAPNHIVYLGVVTRMSGSTVTEIYVKVQNGAELDELSDVSITSAVAGQALMRGATLWENRSLVIADISDATTYVPFLASANSFTNATASTTTSTGALIVSGGVGIGGAINVGGVSSFTSTTRPTAPNVIGTAAPSAGSLITRNDALWEASENSFTQLVWTTPVGTANTTGLFSYGAIYIEGTLSVGAVAGNNFYSSLAANPFVRRGSGVNMKFSNATVAPAQSFIFDLSTNAFSNTEIRLLFGVTAATTQSLAAAGYGIVWTSITTGKLQIHNGTTLSEQSFTIPVSFDIGYIHKWMVTWDGLTLKLYNKYAIGGGALTRWTLLGSLAGTSLPSACAGNVINLTNIATGTNASNCVVYMKTALSSYNLITP